MSEVAGRPSATPTGIRMLTVAAALKSIDDRANSPTAKVQGWPSTIPEMPPTMKVRFPSKNDDPSQATPTMQMTALMPLLIMFPASAFAGEALNSSMVRPAVAIITIMMAAAMVTWSVSTPSGPATS